MQKECQDCSNVACSYYVDGLILEDYARDVLRRVNLAFIGQIVRLRDQALQNDDAFDVKKVGLRYDSRRDSVWPKFSI